MRLLILLGLLTFLTTLTGHSQVGHDTSYYLKKVKGKVLSNKTIGFADTTLALIKGRILDDKSNGVQSEVIITGLQSRKQMTVDTDEDGMFNIYVPAEMYSVTFRQSGHGKFAIDTLFLTSGQIQEIYISLGSRFIVQDWMRIPGDTITIQSKRNLRKASKNH